MTADPARSLLKWGVCSGPEDAKGRDEDCSVVFKYGMKRDFNAWLASLGDRAPVRSLTALREWNRAHQSAGTLKYGQAQLDNSDEMDLAADRARYEADRAKDLALSRGEGIDAVMKTHKLDALHLPRRRRRGHRRQGRLPDGHRAIRHRAEWRRDAGGIQCEAVAVWRQLHGRRLQRAAVDRDRLRVRTDHQTPSSATARLVRDSAASRDRDAVCRRRQQRACEPVIAARRLRRTDARRACSGRRRTSRESS